MVASVSSITSVVSRREISSEVRMRMNLDMRTWRRGNVDYFVNRRLNNAPERNS